MNTRGGGAAEDDAAFVSKVVVILRTDRRRLTVLPGHILTIVPELCLVAGVRHKRHRAVAARGGFRRNVRLARGTDNVSLILPMATTCFTACLSFTLQATARLWPMVQTAREALCITPSVALQSASTRLACRSCSSKPPSTSRMPWNEIPLTDDHRIAPTRCCRRKTRPSRGSGESYQSIRNNSASTTILSILLQSSYRRPILLWRPLNEGIAEISNSSKKSAWVITKAAAGAAFTITQLSVLPPTDSWSPRRRRLPPQDRPILGEARNLPFPLAIDPEVIYRCAHNALHGERALGAGLYEDRNSEIPLHTNVGPGAPAMRQAACRRRFVKVTAIFTRHATQAADRGRADERLDRLSPGWSASVAWRTGWIRSSIACPNYK